MPAYEDIDNLKKIAMGDHESFHSIFLKYYPKIKYFIMHIIKSEAIAEELSQDIFLRIWENRKNILKIRSFNAYMYRIAKNMALNYLEHKFVEKSYMIGYDQPAETDLEENLNAEELLFLVRLAVSRMPTQRRKIFIMSRVYNLEKEKISEKLGLAKKTVENQLSLALKDIREALYLTFIFFI
jgi:RNA polymerase sigma-70 factor (ECF subfamily)